MATDSTGTTSRSTRIIASPKGKLSREPGEKKTDPISFAGALLEGRKQQGSARESLMAIDRSTAILRHIRRLAAGPAEEALTDRELLHRFGTQRDEAAFAALVRRHGRLVLGVCRRVLGQEQDAEDAFQATFLILARKAAARGWRESISNWLYRVAYRLAVRARRQAGRRQARERRPAD